MCGRRQAFQNKVYITNVVVDEKGSFMAKVECVGSIYH